MSNQVKLQKLFRSGLLFYMFQIHSQYFLVTLHLAWNQVGIQKQRKAIHKPSNHHMSPFYTKWLQPNPTKNNWKHSSSLNQCNSKQIVTFHSLGLNSYQLTEKTHIEPTFTTKTERPHILFTLSKFYERDDWNDNLEWRRNTLDSQCIEQQVIHLTACLMRILHLLVYSVSWLW